jgi:hypothetical protein
MDDQGANREGGGMRFRKLRIAWSAACAFVCMLMFPLWLHSFLPGSDYIELGKDPYGIWIASTDGLLEIGSLYDPYDPIQNKALGVSIGIPEWLVGFVLALLAVIPWIRWRLSLRTLLVIMTSLAVILGIRFYIRH